MHRETPPEGTVVGQPGQGDLVTGDFSREHWVVPVHSLTHRNPDAIVQAIACRDGTVILHLTCGNSRTRVQLDACRAAQLSTGIWEAAGTAQQLTRHLDDDQPRPPQPPPTGLGDRPVARNSHSHRSAPPRSSSPGSRPRVTPMTKRAAMDADEARAIGRRIRRIRKAQDKSLEVTAGLAGMSSSTLHRVEHGHRELTLSEIRALANALEVDPSALIRLPILAPANEL